MQLQAVGLGSGMSLTVIHDEHGWRFNSWTHYLRPVPPPPPRDRQRYFSTADDAANYFRALRPDAVD